MENSITVRLKAGVGFEPTNVGFANRCLRPLGYPADAWLRAQFNKAVPSGQEKMCMQTQKGAQKDGKTVILFLFVIEHAV